jgi:hypothetical protein
LLAIAAAAQNAGSHTSTVVPGPQTVIPQDAQTKISDSQAAQRQQQISDDMKKLVDLTGQLKLETDKSGASVLSMDAIKKAEEIQKIAKRVEKNLKGQ